MTRMGLAALLVLCALAPALAGEGTRESLEDAEKPPKMFPDSKAESFSADRMPTPKTPIEAVDMRNNPNNDTEPVHHPNVKDPGTTHAEGSEAGRGSIHACTLPSFQDGWPNSRASDWLADSGNVTKVCHLPVEWLNGNASTLRVCSIPRDAWNSSYAVSDGTIPKELLAELVNTTNVKCVAPREALSNSSAAANDTITSGSIPSAWLRDSDDNIYIYIIPQEWLRESKPASAGKASEVEDLTSESADSATPTPGPEPTAASASPAAVADGANTVAAAATATPDAESGGVANASVEASSNATGADNATAPATASASNSSNTELTPSGSLPVSSSTVAPAAGTTAPNAADASTSAATVTTAAAVAKDVTSEKPKEQTAKTTERPREETTKTPPKPKDESTKATDKPAAAPVVTTAATQKPEEKATETTKEAIAPNPKVEKPDEHRSDAENEIAHGVVSPPPPAALSQQHSAHDHAASASGKTAFLQPTESAAILAGVFVAIALLGYAGLLLWRRVLEKRYGNREMLVNEDDDFDTSDMRHFEL